VFSVAAYFPRNKVEVSGEYRRFTRSSDAGRKVELHFCPECGTTVIWYPEVFPELLAVAVGCFADPHFPAPQRGVWAANRHDWVHLPVGVASFDAQPGPPSSTPSMGRELDDF
jgi:hypothetical protein